MRNLLYPKMDSWSSLHLPTPTLNLYLRCSSAYLWQLHPSSCSIQTLKSSLIPSYIPYSISNALANPLGSMLKIFPICDYFSSSSLLPPWDKLPSFVVWIISMVSQLVSCFQIRHPSSLTALSLLGSFPLRLSYKARHKNPLRCNSDHIPSAWKASNGHLLTWNKT